MSEITGHGSRRVERAPGRQFEDTFAAGIGWTADGRAILFNRDHSGRTTDIVRIDLVSKAMTTLTGRPEDDGRFAVSNDGSTIAFQSDRLPAGIYLMGVDGSDVRHLAVLGTTGSPRVVESGWRIPRRFATRRLALPRPHRHRRSHQVDRGRVGGRMAALIVRSDPHPW